jgi:hypothetical protein
MKNKDNDDNIPPIMMETETITSDEDEKRSIEVSMGMLVRNPGKYVSKV